MIWSGVEPCGGALSSGPSWACAGRTASPQTSAVKVNTVRQNSRRRGTDVMGLVYRNPSEARKRLRRPCPPVPLRSVRPEGRALQFCHLIGCDRRTEVAVSWQLKESVGRLSAEVPDLGQADSMLAETDR